MKKIFILSAICTSLYAQASKPVPLPSAQDPTNEACQVTSATALRQYGGVVYSCQGTLGTPGVYKVLPGGSGGTITEVSAGTGLGGGGSTGSVQITLAPAAIGVIGGVQATTQTTHQWINSIDTSGVPQKSQPSAADISGLGPYATTPTVSGDGTLNGTSGALSVTKTGGVSFGGLATQTAPNSAVLGSTSGGAPIDITRAVGQSNSKSYLVDYRSVKDPQFAGGATGNGSTDDQAALQAAFTAGGTIHIPPGGTYLHSSSLLVGANTNIICDGGLGSSAILRGTNSTPGVYANAVNFNGANNSSISGCNIDSLATSRQNQVLAAAIYIGGGQNIRVTGNNIGVTWGPGIFVASLNATGGTAGATQVLLDSNIINGSLSNGIIIRSSPTKVTVTNNQVYNCGDGGIEVSSAIGDLNPTSDIVVQGNIVSGCVVGINSAGGLRLHVKNNTVINPGTQGITIYQDVGFQVPTDVEVIDNHVYGATNTSYNSIAISSVVGATVSGNVVSGSQGISVASTNPASNLSIRNNHVYNVPVGNGFVISGNVSGMDVSGNTVNGVSAGNCISISNTTAAVSDLMLSQNHCSNITGANAGVGIIDVVGSVLIGGTGNFVGGTNTTNAGAIRLAGGATTASSFNIGTMASLDQISSPTAATAWVFPDVGLAITGTAPGSVAGNGTDALSILSITGTPGGATSGTTGQTAGTGAGMSFTAGTGGAASSGSTTGKGGTLLLNGGAPGTGGGTSGTRGPVIMQSIGGQVIVGTATPVGSASEYVTSSGVALEINRTSGAGVIQLDNSGTASAQVTALSGGGGALKNASGSAIAHEWDASGNNFFGTSQQTEIDAAGKASFAGLRNIPTSTDPVCTAAGDIGKQWMDNTSAVTTHFKVCGEVASTPAWVTVF